MITLDQKGAAAIAARLRRKNIQLIDTPLGKSAGFTLATNSTDTRWEFRVGRPNGRGRCTLDGWKLTANEKGVEKAPVNWMVPIEGKLTAEKIGSAAAKILREQKKFDTGTEPNWDIVYAAEEVKKEWLRSL